MSSGSGQVIPACLAISKYFPTVTWESVLRQTLDNVPTDAILPVFSSLLQRLQRGKQLLAYKLESGHHLIALDGSQYFSSEKIHCPSCLTYKKTRGSIRYSHQILQAVMLNPHMRQVLPWPRNLWPIPTAPPNRIARSMRGNGS